MAKTGKKRFLSSNVKKFIRAQKYNHMQKGSTLVVGPYVKKRGAETYYLSERGTNEGKKVTFYNSPNSSKGGAGAIVRTTTKKYYHGSSIGDLKSKLGM